MPLQKLPTLQFGEWLPDLGVHQNPGTALAKNCVPVLRGYSQLRSLQSVGGSLDNPCLGAFWSLNSAASKFNFAGDESKLYLLNAVDTEWDDVSKAGGYNTTTVDAGWDFTKFGDRVLATNRDNVVQYYDTDAGGLFADLPNAPQAKVIGVVRDFVVVGDIVEGSATKPNFVAWSGFNNSEIWGTNRSAQSDEQELRGRSGRIQRIVPGQTGFIFTEQSIWQMSYVGPPIIFRFDEVQRNSGTPAWRSVTWAEGEMFWLGYDGFKRWNGSGTPVDIGANRVDKWFFENVAGGAQERVQAAIDRRNALVFWAFGSSSVDVLDRVLIYNWHADRWAYAELTVQFFIEYAPLGFNLDTLDTILSGGLDGADSADFTVDSPAYQGDPLGLLVFNSSNRASSFSGAPLTAEIDTTELDTAALRNRLFVNEVESLIEGEPTAVNLRVGFRERLQDNVQLTPAAGLNAIGTHPVRASGRFMKARVSIEGGFSLAKGVRMIGREAGKR